MKKLLLYEERIINHEPSKYLSCNTFQKTSFYYPRYKSKTENSLDMDEKDTRHSSYDINAPTGSPSCPSKYFYWVYEHKDDGSI